MTQYVSAFLDDDSHAKLNSFKELFLKWNQRINLSAARTGSEIDEHIRDSLHVLEHLQHATRVVDVGSGGGFPVLIAAACLPSIQFTALEPVHKKHAFLRTAARELDLVNFEAFAVRVEDHAVHDYDAATSRATFDLREWLLLGSSLVRPDGIIVGFEAIRRDDLPQPLLRFPYELDGKTRSIVVVRRHP